MRRLVALAAALALVFSAAVCFVSCKQKKKDLKEEVYTISFSTAYLTSSALAPASQKVKRGEAAELPDARYEVRAGYVVVWARDGLSPSAYDFSAPVTESFTLYAVEVPKSYKITYLLEMGKNVKANPTIYDKTSDIILSNAVAPFGYKFVKWSYYDDPESVVTRIEKGTEGDLVLRAVFTPVRYGVLYVGLEGAENPNADTYLFGEEMPLESPLREGYRFLGFTINGQAGGAVVERLTPTFVEENQTALFRTNGSHIALYANWEEAE